MVVAVQVAVKLAVVFRVASTARAEVLPAFRVARRAVHVVLGLLAGAATAVVVSAGAAMVEAAAGVEEMAAAV